LGNFFLNSLNTGVEIIISPILSYLKKIIFSINLGQLDCFFDVSLLKRNAFIEFEIDILK